MQQQTLFYHLSYIDKTGERQIFYIGRTGVGLRKRLYQHRKLAKRKSTPKALFLRQLEESGFVIEITAISAVDTYDLDVVATIEDRLIARYLQKGCMLINSATGFAGSVRSRASKPVFQKVTKGQKEQKEKVTNKGRSYDNIEWTTEMEMLLGKIGDAAIARRFGISKSAVAWKRETKQIPEAAPYMVWTKDMDNLLGTMPDKELAELLQIKKIKVTGRRLQFSIPPFGK